VTVDDVSRDFWAAAGHVLRRDDVETGTMMGFPCVRTRGAFFASSERRTGDLVVKLPAARVQTLIASGEAVPFAPNGRVFREWARLPERDERRWRELIDEALDFVQAGAVVP
jgi:hypothetical protein